MEKDRGGRGRFRSCGSDQIFCYSTENLEKERAKEGCLAPLFGNTQQTVRGIRGGYRIASASTSAPPRLRSGANAVVVLDKHSTSALWRGKRSRNRPTTDKRNLLPQCQGIAKGAGFQAPLALLFFFHFFSQERKDTRTSYRLWRFRSSVHKVNGALLARSAPVPLARARIPRPQERRKSISPPSSSSASSAGG